MTVLATVVEASTIAAANELVKKVFAVDADEEEKRRELLVVSMASTECTSTYTEGKGSY